MRITFWLIVIAILIGMVGSSGCAVSNKYFYASVGMTGPTTVARHGFHSAIFTNGGRHPVIVRIVPTGDVFTVYPGRPAIVKLSEGLHRVYVSDAAGKSLGRPREFFVPDEVDYNGTTYAAWIKTDGRR